MQNMNINMIHFQRVLCHEGNELAKEKNVGFVIPILVASHKLKFTGNHYQVFVINMVLYHI